MERTVLSFLRRWIHEKGRLPLVMRGARQVGKTWVVRRLAELENRDLIELNLEFEPELESLFVKNDPKAVLLSIEDVLHRKVDPSKALLFIDEIQAKPHLIAKLRWFAEMMPELPVITAGSLLEFALGTYAMSMPVGRIEYVYLEPLSFEEFLLAHQKDGFLRLIKSFQWGDEIPLIAHQKLLSLFHEYVIIGGMPAAVEKWIDTRSLEDVSRIHRRIVTTYRQDFTKYGQKISPEIMDKLMNYIPRSLGEKLVYSRVDKTAPLYAIQQAIKALEKARVCHIVHSTAANGIPLAAEINEKFSKVIFVDVGLCSASLELSLTHLESVEDLSLVNKGALAEQVTGQLLRTVFPVTQDPQLYYWVRLHQNKGALAEVDYLIAHGAQAVPIEVKAGATGSLKSLHTFMGLKKLSKALRICSGAPNISPVTFHSSSDASIHYELRSIPFYMIGEIHRLLTGM